MSQSLRFSLAIVAALVLLSGCAVAFGIPAALALAATFFLVAVVINAIDYEVSNAQAEPAAVTQPSHGSSEEIRGLQAALLDGVPDPALIVNAQSCIVAANKAARTMFGASVGAPVTAAIRAPGLLGALESARRDGVQSISDFEMSVPVERSLTVVATPIDKSTVDQSVTETLVVLRDNTAEEQLAKMRADFVANASHELRTPLASLKGFIETLQVAAKEDPHAREQFLNIMLDQANRMTRLIDDLLSLSRVELREHVPPRDKVDLAEVAARVTQAMQPIAESANRKLGLSDSHSPVIVTGDADELGQVLQNLIQNAIRYGKPGGLIEVSVSQKSGWAALSVRDDGIGIAPEHLPRLTERFYRVSAKDSRERGGTGLGLAIVKHIVNRHGGTLDIESIIASGSTFTVTIPMKTP